MKAEPKLSFVFEVHFRGRVRKLYFDLDSLDVDALKHSISLKLGISDSRSKVLLRYLDDNLDYICIADADDVEESMRFGAIFVEIR